MIFETTKGKVSGTLEDHTHILRGVPYAKPPIGPLRFTPPVEMDSWTDVKECISFSHCATQSESILINTTPDEDCLYLNIFAPEDTTQKHPVFFWVHGGGFFNGCGSMNYYDGRFFAQHGIVVVTINYRLGALGFLGLKTLLDEYNTTGNWGLLDQIAALKWVNENIHAFGGDPSKITIAGESAGSFSISNLIMSPKAKGLFHQAILESGSLFANRIAVPYTRSELDATIDMSKRYASIFGANDDKQGLEILRGIPAMKLWETGFFSSDSTVDAPYAFWSTLDGTTLPKDPVSALRNGDYNPCDVIIGYNRDEGICFIPDESKDENIEAFYKKIFTNDELQKAKEILSPLNKSGIEFGRDLITYIYFKAGMTLMKNELSKQGHNVYAYQFNFTPDGNYPLAQMGAHHACEIPFVFDTSDFVGVHYSQAGDFIEKEMHQLWSNFITNGNPNQGIELPAHITWKPYTKEDPQIFMFDSDLRCEKTKDQAMIEDFIKLMYH